ncbi:MAG TPA: hypothetical protein VJ836_06050 [Candidatus Saccharimonadales bacterium]|nr:hypothetical protein [Candidatus Saccharimonadales bacterium]
MASMVIGLIIVFLFGLYAGHSPLGKWPKAEMIASALVALALIVAALLWSQYTQGACQPPSDAIPYGSSGVCKELFTFKNVCIAYFAYLIGLSVGAAYRFVVNCKK